MRMSEARLMCDNCAHIMTRDELKQEMYYVGECHGSPAYDSRSVCPECGNDDFIEVEICDSCGEIIGNGYDGLCLSCLMENATLGNAIAIGMSGNDDDEISHFFEECLTRDEINQVLRNHIENNIDLYKDNIREYCEKNLDILSYIVRSKDNE